ncbi:BPTI/Kunitz domain-containing protein 4-like [Mizuhopecten yessoensis]|uniref:BPTI/Kunitz domain-containing protein 4-like n=1 Tax=Mizuhopecten yessoensis TaxID=6573 RepID=UPI000B45C71E|nr:BPTI/Kunitz domain-containing protein 4-like [Mizuhopecten yessoensis]
MNSFLPLLLAAGLVCVYGASLDRALCGPICMMYCQYGNVEDDDGCPICQCKPNPDSLVVREIQPQQGCPAVMCMIYCPNGHLLGSDGCPQCACV